MILGKSPAIYNGHQPPRADDPYDNYQLTHIIQHLFCGMQIISDFTIFSNNGVCVYGVRIYSYNPFLHNLKFEEIIYLIFMKCIA